MKAELSTLTELQDDFGSDDGSRLATYCSIRAAMYRAGYDNPVEAVFQRIRKGKKLLQRSIGGGLHEKFIERLAGIDSKLNSRSPGLADKGL